MRGLNYTRALRSASPSRVGRHECAAQLAAVRRGIQQLVPVQALRLFTADEIERMVCGESDWSVAQLKRSADVRMEPSAPCVTFLWEALESFSRAELELFLRFVWGRSRMPRGEEHRMIVDHLHTHGDPDERLPTSSTCFFQLHLPAYSRQEVLRARLLYAIYNCRGMDLA
eukprot:4147061-Pleurochrysis_carterae.AAC.1